MLDKLLRLVFDLSVFLVPLALLDVVLAVVWRRFRAKGAKVLLYPIQIWFLSAWFLSCALVYQVFGLRSLILGSLLFVIGIVPYALLGFAARHYWPEFLTIAGPSLCAFLALGASIWLTSKCEEPGTHATDRHY